MVLAAAGFAVFSAFPSASVFWSPATLPTASLIPTARALPPLFKTGLAGNLRQIRTGIVAASGDVEEI